MCRSLVLLVDCLLHLNCGSVPPKLDSLGRRQILSNEGSECTNCIGRSLLQDPRDSLILSSVLLAFPYPFTIHASGTSGCTTARIGDEGA